MQAKPPLISMQAAREEAELVMFSSIKELLDSCGMSARQVRAILPDLAASLNHEATRSLCMCPSNASKGLSRACMGEPGYCDSAIVMVRERQKRSAPCDS